MAKQKGKKKGGKQQSQNTAGWAENKPAKLKFKVKLAESTGRQHRMQKKKKNASVVVRQETAKLCSQIEETTGSN